MSVSRGDLIAGLVKSLESKPFLLAGWGNEQDRRVVKQNGVLDAKRP